MDRFGKEVLIACTTIVLVIALGAVTGLAALRAAVSRQDQARTIDQHILSIEKLRDDVREATASARRYMSSGDHREQQRVLALFDDMKQERAGLRARYTLDYGPVLEADLDAYELGLLAGMSEFEPEPVERLTRFEDQLAGVRLPLAATFDDLIAREREHRATLRSVHSLGTSAQWTLLLASCIGIMLAIGLGIAVVRRRPERDGGSPRMEPTSRGSQPLLRESFEVAQLVDEVVTSQRGPSSERGLRLRYDSQTRAHVQADRERVRDVLGAIVSAAIATSRPSSELIIHVSDSPGVVRIALIGPGATLDEESADPIALLMCRRIVEAHGGKLGVQTSSISRTYWFTLPTESQPALLR